MRGRAGGGGSTERAGQGLFLHACICIRRCFKLPMNARDLELAPLPSLLHLFSLLQQSRRQRAAAAGAGWAAGLEGKRRSPPSLRLPLT